MSIGTDLDRDNAGLLRKRRLAAAAFIALLALSVFWPAPAISINDLCCHAALTVDQLSFLGREAPSWDVAFWCLAGLFAIALLKPSPAYAWRDDFGEGWSIARSVRVRVTRTDVVLLLAGAAAVAMVWRFADAPVTAWAERVQSDDLQDAIRYANRFGGGMNPAMVVLFFLLAGVAYRHRRWIEYAVTMTIAGAAAGIVAQVLKYSVGRTRPELWLGPFQHARAAATSFPSGHTIGAFALGGVLLFASPSRAMRLTAVLLAIVVGLSRIFAFRHWMSDVLASAFLGILVALIVTRDGASRG